MMALQAARCFRRPRYTFSAAGRCGAGEGAVAAGPSTAILQSSTTRETRDFGGVGAAPPLLWSEGDRRGGDRRSVEAVDVVKRSEICVGLRESLSHTSRAWHFLAQCGGICLLRVTGTHVHHAGVARCEHRIAPLLYKCHKRWRGGNLSMHEQPAHSDLPRTRILAYAHLSGTMSGNGRARE